MLRADGKEMVLDMFMASLLSEDIPSDPAIPATFLFAFAHKENYPHTQILVTF